MFVTCYNLGGNDKALASKIQEHIGKTPNLLVGGQPFVSSGATQSQAWAQLNVTP